MQKLGLIFLIFVAVLGFSACGDSKDSKAETSADSGESQTINANDSQSESNESSADLGESQTLDSQDLRETKSK